MSEQNHGSFFTGFTVGLFAGAAGLFLFKTKDGKKVWDRLQNEWQAAREYLQEKDLITKDKSLKSMLYEWFDLEVPAVNTPTAKKKSKTTPTAPKSSKKPKFKGV